MPARRILVIEDERSARDALGSLLLDEGHSVRTAASGKDGLRCFREFHPDAVLCDVMLPDIDGLQVLRQARALANNQVFFIIVTAGGSAEAVERALRSEADHFIEKPIDLRQLRSALAAIDGSAAARPDTLSH